MKQVQSSVFRRFLKEYLDIVTDGPLTIARRDGTNVVVISESHFIDNYKKRENSTTEITSKLEYHSA